RAGRGRRHHPARGRAGAAAGRRRRGLYAQGLRAQPHHGGHRADRRSDRGVACEDAILRPKVRPRGPGATKRERNNHFKSIAAPSGPLSGTAPLGGYGPPLTRRSLTRPFAHAMSCGRNGRSDVLSAGVGGDCPMKRLFFACGGLIAVAAALRPAAAAEADVYGPPPVVYGPPVTVVIFTWTGFYFGGHVGGGWGSKNETGTPY